MKRISRVLLLATLCTTFLTPALAQQISQSSLESLKIKLKTVSNDGLILLKQSKSCFDKVNNDAEFNQCVSAIPEKLKPDILNLFSSSNNVLNLRSKSEKNLSYSQSNNQKIVDYLETSINSISTMLTCLDHSIDSNQLLSCIDRKQTSNSNNRATGRLSEDW
ncbi:MAG: hypothetical protein N0C81_01040 [Candidatus Thiodiazotropha lotti]|uniref:Uncharacterized protein n=1 Tax=Candidatus Thiodiazotropha lotti TaxID=2792787 RepID=A0A9E4N0C5_9GAMM|nr:hypothetical protein [Candidatus Thiodiazotropha lotti]ODC00799.1 hypothetical protein A3197_10930 [Candidatus Thiodiazotropha endoloripes]MCG7919995.1 hypothetical protein [Candidatus Thiodiazotropha lotti]MCG7938389.1 hypothetical protein [Candidatus Thiodiazotropha lotti]MCG7985799.1 hypothetical protein [Candidatus Thiodiazotropha lotti]